MKLFGYILMFLTALDSLAYLMSLLYNMVSTRHFGVVTFHLLSSSCVWNPLFFFYMHFLSYWLLLLTTLSVFLCTFPSFRAVLQIFFISVWQQKIYVQYHRFWTAQRYLSELNHYLPESVTWCRNILPEGDIWNYSGESHTSNACFFAMVEKGAEGHWLIIAIYTVDT